MKKSWISVKRGFVTDPKHRQAMGECVWLFMLLLDQANWEDGIVHDWTDVSGAEEMALPITTLRFHRRKLETLGYITCVQNQHGQSLIVHNWTNPREYTGAVYNPAKGEIPAVQGDNQGDNPLTPSSGLQSGLQSG